MPATAERLNRFTESVIREMTRIAIRHNAINAFAVPGGNLFVFTGLVLAMEHESELAGVLGHEMAHATQRHIAGRIEKMQKKTIPTWSVAAPFDS